MAPGQPAPKRRGGKGCRMAPRLPWRAVVICEAAFGIGVASVVGTGIGTQTGEGAEADLRAAVVLG